MKKELLKSLKEKIANIDNIRLAINIEKRNQVISVKESSSIVELIIGLEEVGNIKLFSSMFYKEQDLVLITEEKYQHKNVECQILKIVLKSKVLFKIIFVDRDEVLNLMDGFSNYEVIVDKDRVISKKDVQKNRIDLPSPEEFNNSSKNFYFKLAELSIMLENKNLVRANYFYDNLKKDLLALANIYISIKYSQNIQNSVYGEGLNIYLDKELYEDYQEIFSTNDVDSFWTSIFLMAGLYRKMGLEISRKMSFEYPKLEDRETMSFIRQIYLNMDGGRR